MAAVAADKRNKQQKDRLTAHHRSLSEPWKKLDAEVKGLAEFPRDRGASSRDRHSGRDGGCRHQAKWSTLR